MTGSSERDRLKAQAGLCAECVHSRRIESSKGSQFFLCRLSATDPGFAKYPRLPVLSCSGYTPSAAAEPVPE